MKCLRSSQVDSGIGLPAFLDIYRRLKANLSSISLRFGYINLSAAHQLQYKSKNFMYEAYSIPSSTCLIEIFGKAIVA